jgi:hypothetical protein
MALFRHVAMSNLSPLCASKRTRAKASRFMMGSRPSENFLKNSHYLSASQPYLAEMPMHQFFFKPPKRRARRS